VLDVADGPSSLAVALSSAVELLRGHIDAVAVNKVCWGTGSALVAAVLHLPNLGPELELLGSGCNADLAKDQVDTLWYCASFLRLPTALLMVWGWSSDGSFVLSVSLFCLYVSRELG
jgi:hypothetical protein